MSDKYTGNKISISDYPRTKDEEIRFYREHPELLEDEVNDEKKSEKSHDKKADSSKGIKKTSNKKKDIDKNSKKSSFDARNIIRILCVVVAALSLGYFISYNYQAQHSDDKVDNLSRLKETDSSNVNDAFLQEARVNLDNQETPDILEEYLGAYAVNKKLVGWITIDGTHVDYPVLQTVNNEYYLDHNFDQEEDRNGSIFLDKDCSIWPRSQNLILYGHNMKSGKMFGSLKSYKSEDFFKKHPQIKFDTIYEKGTYDVMFVFSEIVHEESEVTFRYYQFINANSDVEYNSYMKDMAEMSLYDTGVKSVYGDALITLSTCDYSQNAERFVIVAKKVN